MGDPEVPEVKNGGAPTDKSHGGIDGRNGSGTQGKREDRVHPKRMGDPKRTKTNTANVH